MRDDGNDILVLDPPKQRDVPSSRAGATIIPFPAARARPQPVRQTDVLSVERATALVIAQIVTVLGGRTAAHVPTMHAALGALAGFACQQTLLLEGGTKWAQPMRAEHLDCMLLNDQPRDGSLWAGLCAAAGSVGSQHLPDADKLLQSTLRCVGTSQFGRITLPLEYKLMLQPQEALIALWAPMCDRLRAAGASAEALPRLFAAVSAQHVVIENRSVPPHVALRIVMQAALAMALIEPRIIPGAVTKPHSN